MNLTKNLKWLKELLINLTISRHKKKRYLMQKRKYFRISYLVFFLFNIFKSIPSIINIYFIFFMFTKDIFKGIFFLTI